MAAHGQSGHLEETDEEAKHQGSEDSSLPADPIHASGYGQTIQVRMSTTSKSNIKIKTLNLCGYKNRLTLLGPHIWPFQKMRAQRIEAGTV